MSPDPEVVRRGEIYWVDWDPSRGSEQANRRPALVVQEDPASANPRYPLTIVAAISTRGHPVRSHVPISPSAQNGLSQVSYVKCEQLMTIRKARLCARIGELGTQEMERVCQALGIVLAIAG